MTIRRNDDPPDDSGFIEFKRQGVWFAYDEGDRVFAYVPHYESPERDDGYIQIGSYTCTHDEYQADLNEIADAWLKKAKE